MRERLAHKWSRLVEAVASRSHLWTNNKASRPEESLSNVCAFGPES